MNTRLRGSQAPMALIEGIAELYANAPEGVNQKNALSRAKASSDAFETYFHHAAPFSHEMLDALWQYCQTEPECSEARAEAALVLGG